MKKILLLLLAVLGVSYSQEPKAYKEMKKTWIDTVYDQDWYWTVNYVDVSSDSLVPFQSDGSFVADVCPWDETRSDFPKQKVIFTIDTVVSETQVYYSFPYIFNGETLILYRGVAKGISSETQTTSLYWSSFYNNYKLPDINASNAEKREWLIEYYTKNNMDFHEGETLAVKDESYVDLFLLFIQTMVFEILTFPLQLILHIMDILPIGTEY